MKKRLSPIVHNKSLPPQASLDQIAGDALHYLAADPDRMSHFFLETGLAPADLRAAAGKPDFAATLLDYLATDERLFVGFAAANGHDPAALDSLRRRLSPQGWDA